MPSSDKPSLSLIIPAYNEEGGIAAAIAESLQTLKSSGIPYEIIVINDGSTDNTKKIIEEKLGSDPRLKLFSKANGGIGSAIRKGIEHAILEYITFVPVDSPLTPELLTAFLSHIGEADVLVSCRVARRGYSLRMKINSEIYRSMISILFGLRLKDYNWIHMYKRTAFDKDIKIECDGIFMLAEILIKAHRKGYTFCEFPVEMRERSMGVKTSATLKAAFRTAKDTLAFFIKSRR